MVLELDTVNFSNMNLLVNYLQSARQLLTNAESMYNQWAFRRRFFCVKLFFDFFLFYLKLQEIWWDKKNKFEKNVFNSEKQHNI